MQRIATTLVIAACALGVLSDAQARPPCDPGQPCVVLRPRRPATHFIAELNGGSSTYGGGGLALGGVLGVGGKLRGFPPIFYLMGEFSYNQAAESGSMPLSGTGYRDDRSFLDLVVGLRIYLPIWGPIRLFGDVGVGASYVSANLEQHDGPIVAADGWMSLFQFSGGVQVRLFHSLSVGLRLKGVVGNEQAISGLYNLVGETLPIRTMATANLVWHF
ncbi:MAG: hypothetical protein CSA65_03675 [Proteobacteria bacterium]|nr:MAG: hypothetical protein CSA65_03675 [Pseudomonadota bacterium]